MYDFGLNKYEANDEHISHSNVFGTDRLSILSKLSDKVGTLSNDEFTQILDYIEKCSHDSRSQHDHLKPDLRDPKTIIEELAFEFRKERNTIKNRLKSPESSDREGTACTSFYNHYPFIHNNISLENFKHGDGNYQDAQYHCRVDKNMMQNLSLIKKRKGRHMRVQSESERRKIIGKTEWAKIFDDIQQSLDS